MLKSIIITLALLTQTAFANDRQFVATPNADRSTGVNFTIGYTFGTHTGRAEVVNATAILDENDNLKSARFAVPIENIRTGNSTRDCHLREALGIDYANSSYPRNHVCDNNNTIPQSGPDSIRHSQIVFQFVSFNRAPSLPLRPGVWQEAVVTGNIGIHGVGRRINALPVRILMNRNGTQTTIRITADFALGLSEFGIQVRPLSIGIGKIRVADQARVLIDTILSGS